ncbi:hypothetical protein pipiens_005435 [Culex pipiens pipiens]|uniref:Uncharacterized protein n=1 Tax=Culex pipiens pipiens TaxID=38569 RepID=A0ABD1DWS9_CULPP
MDPEIVVQRPTIYRLSTVTTFATEWPRRRRTRGLDAEVQLYHLEMVQEQWVAAESVLRELGSSTVGCAGCGGDGHDAEIGRTKIDEWTDFSKLLMEERVAKMCIDLIALKPGVVFTEKGVSDLAHHFLTPTIVNQTEELTKKEGNGTGLFEIKKVDDEYFCFATERTNPKAWTISSMVPSRTSLPKLANRAAKKRIVTHPGEAREPVDSFCVRINTARLPGIPRLGSPLAVQQVARRNPRQPKDGKQANHP